MESESSQRAALFLDYQNMYRSAREAFGLASAPAQHGNLSPLALGTVVAQQAGVDLSEVRVYTGIPTPHKSPTLHAMMQRRIAAWKRSSTSARV